MLLYIEAYKDNKHQETRPNTFSKKNLSNSFQQQKTESITKMKNQRKDLFMYL